MGDFGRVLMLIGAGIFVLGVLLVVAGKVPWLGRLPGDIVVQRGPVSFYFPIVTCIVVSLLINVLLWLFRR
jgi:hypothetical protein